MNFLDRSFYLTGGHDGYNSSKSVFYYKVADNAWFKAPHHLKQDRHSHGSCLLKSKLWVFGGRCGHHFLDSLEVYDVLHEYFDWQVMGLKMLTKRSCFAISPLSDTEFIIMGGTYDGSDLQDVVILDTANMKPKQIETDPPMAFSCQS